MASSPHYFTSSPPVEPADPPDEVPELVEKTSRDHVDDGLSSSATMTGDNTLAGMEHQTSTDAAQQPLSEKPSSQAHSSMAPPPKPTPKGPSSSLLTPHSGQGSGKPPEAVLDVEKPAKAAIRQVPASKHDTPYSTAQTSQQDFEWPEDSQMSDPDGKIEVFDWQDHESRYHAKMTELQQTESEIMHEFGSLCQYFDVWSQAGSRHEVDRSFKRMKTQATLVQHHEDELEQKRQHYIQVVNAFRSALQLLAK